MLRSKPPTLRGKGKVSAYKSCQAILSPESDRIGAIKSKIRHSKNYLRILGYKQTLEAIADRVVELYQAGKAVQLNLLTDRLILTAMERYR